MRRAALVLTLVCILHTGQIYNSQIRAVAQKGVSGEAATRLATAHCSTCTCTPAAQQLQCADTTPVCLACRCLRSDTLRASDPLGWGRGHQRHLESPQTAAAAAHLLPRGALGLALPQHHEAALGSLIPDPQGPDTPHASQCQLRDLPARLAWGP